MKPTFCFLALALLAFAPRQGMAQLYYDTNGATPGTSTSSTQNFTDSVWTTDSTGSIVTTGYTPNSDVVFSAGTNGTGAQNVTITDTESANSFTFNNGTVTLLGSGSPNLSIGAGGVIVNSTDGVTTFDSTLGTVTLSASQSWNNKTSLAFNVNSGVTGSGQTLSFNGIGSGNVNISGQLTGNLNLTQSSTTSTLDLLNANNNFTGTITASGGTIAFATPGSFGGGGNTIELDHGGTLFFTNDGFSVGALGNNVVLGTGGGKFASGVDNLTNDVVTGGTGLTITSGDFIPESNAASDVGTLNVTGGRLLAFGDGIFGNNAIVNVSSGATLDFGQNDTLNNAINLADGSAMENRSGGITLTNVVFAPTETVTLGADDVGGGSMTISSGINLTGTLTLDLNENHPNGGNDTLVNLSGNITGAGGLVLTLIPGASNQGTMYLSGNNSYNGPTTINNVTVAPFANGFGSSAVTLNSTTGPATVLLTGGNLSNQFTANVGTSVFNLVAASDQTLSGPIELGTNGGSLTFVNSTASNNLTVGSIDFSTILGNRGISVDDTSTGFITLDGTYTSLGSNQSNPAVAGGSTINLGDNGNGAGNYRIGPDANFSQFETDGLYSGSPTISLSAGNLYIDNSSFVSGQYISASNNAGTNHTIFLVGAQNIQATLFSDQKHGPAAFGSFTVNQSTQDHSTWSGPVSLDSTQMVTSAVAGGRLEFSGDIFGASPTGLIKTGAGVVVFSNFGGNDYGLTSAPDSVSPGVTGTVAMDIQQGTLLIKNQSGSAFGNNSGIVKVEAGATLGGSGTSHQKVVAADATSVIAPGDAGQANLGIAPSIANLSLSGGVDAINGLTMDFKLNGLADNGELGVVSDQLSISDFNFNNAMTINVSSLNGIVDTTNPYILITGSDTWTEGANTSFTINAPTGYADDLTYGADQGTPGYILDTTQFGETFSVRFVATPEPSTYGLMGLGLLSLIAIRRWRKLRA